MAQQLQRFSAATTPTETIVAAIHSDGGCIVERLFDEVTIAEMREAVLAKAVRDAAGDAAPGSASFGYAAAVDVATKEAREAGTSYVGNNTIRFCSLGKIAPAPFFRMVDNAVYKSVADAILLPFCGTYWMNTAQAMLIGPNSPAQPLHTDEGVWAQVTHRHDNAPEITVGAMIGLDTVDEAVGATRVKPYGAAESVPAELKPGDALLYSGKVPHGGGANVTKDRVSYALVHRYVPLFAAD